MSMIDTQNAKQIRDPMDVLITMELPDEGVTLTYSGYSTAKVADGELGETSWPMRQIADLQGEGFPLDGSHVLYNPSTPASAVNGKIGVRSNIGETVTVTVTANRSVASLTIFATGASSVEYNGQTAAIVGGSVVIPVGATSVTLTFNPVSETERIEVSDITAGTTFRITNDSLIKAVVSLRSDLSPFGQTLPESEINIYVYQDADISEAVATIPEDTPITYQAGYPGDMSPVRKFYVSGKVTWADNVLHIQGVDAVHFLDKSMPGDLYIRTTRAAYTFMRYGLTQSGVDIVHRDVVLETTESEIIIEKMTYREAISTISSIFDISVNGDAYHPLYIDAGRPTLLAKPNTAARFIINESDCAQVDKSVRAAVSEATIQAYTIDDKDVSLWREVGSFDWEKGVGAFPHIDRYTIMYNPSFANGQFEGRGWYSTDGAYPVIPSDEFGGRGIEWSISDEEVAWVGIGLLSDDVAQGEARSFSGDAMIYTQVIPWGCYYDSRMYFGVNSQNDFWAEWVRRGIWESSQTNTSGILWGHKFTKYPKRSSFSMGQNGQRVEYNIDRVWGYVTGHEFPDESIKNQLMKSPVSYSFTWKGDPRMQPRDVVSWQRLDGTTEEITMENITLTHEKGGTLAEITARKGVI